MSIEKKSNGRYLARWREPNGRSGRAFDRKVDADRFLATVTVDQPAGPLHRPDGGGRRSRSMPTRWATRSRGASRRGTARRSSTRRSCRRSAMPAPGRASVRRAGVGRRMSAQGSPRPPSVVLPGARPVMRAARRDRLIHESPASGCDSHGRTVASSLTVLTTDRWPPGRRRCRAATGRSSSSLRASGCARAKPAPSPSTASTSSAAR